MVHGVCVCVWEGKGGVGGGGLLQPLPWVFVVIYRETSEIANNFCQSC